LKSIRVTQLITTRKKLLKLY